MNLISISAIQTGSTCDDPTSTGASITDQCKGANSECLTAGNGQFRCQCPTDYYDSNGGVAGGDCKLSRFE